MARELDDPLEPGGEDEEPSSRGHLAALSVAALGIVYGDIGTSPLYAVRECFGGSNAVAVGPATVLGILSLISWSLVLVISLKYLLYILRADNNGEGGILALMALLHPAEDDGADRAVGAARRFLVAIGLFGATLLYGDGTITPAISVLSAVEGLEVATPVFEPYVVPIAVAILIGLFALQRRGTGGVARVFGPVMLVWFSALAALGLAAVMRQPQVLEALNPIHGARFLLDNGFRGYVVLSAVFLVVTGGEALYADIGHFGKSPIRLSWFGFVLPALLLNYFGQGALLLEGASAAVNPFYKLAPQWALYPLVLLATAATVIASQAVISGAFSLTRQAIQLGYCPRMTIRHTSAERVGQVFLPGVNWTLMVLTIVLVLAFRRSSALAGAYGVAVSTTMVITTLLAAWVCVEHWGWPRWVVAALSTFFLLIDLAFFGANLTKIPAGGWFPIVLACAVYLFMSTWKRGMDLVRRHFRGKRTPLETFITRLSEEGVQRVPGTAVFLSASRAGTPTALVNQLEFNHVIHERVIVLTVRTRNAPHVPARERVEIEELPAGFYRVVACFGFMQTPRVPALLAVAAKLGLAVDPDQASFFVSREVAIPTDEIGMSKWRAWIFSLLARNAQRPSEFFHLPHRRVIELGVEVEL